jgi:hypothetical protein
MQRLFLWNGSGGFVDYARHVSSVITSIDRRYFFFSPPNRKTPREFLQEIQYARRP